MNFRFNDELLLSEHDRDIAQQSYPNVFFALDHPALRAEFERVDGLAVKAKNRSRRIGCAALVFATLSLLTFPLEHVIKGIFPSLAQQPALFQDLAIAGACFGILALIFGNLGLGFGKVKRNWLMKRLMHRATAPVARTTYRCSRGGNRARRPLRNGTSGLA